MAATTGHYWSNLSVVYALSVMLTSPTSSSARLSRHLPDGPLSRVKGASGFHRSLRALKASDCELDGAPSGARTSPTAVVAGSSAGKRRRVGTFGGAAGAAAGTAGAAAAGAGAAAAAASVDDDYPLGSGVGGEDANTDGDSSSAIGAGAGATHPSPPSAHFPLTCSVPPPAASSRALVFSNVPRHALANPSHNLSYESTLRFPRPTSPVIDHGVVGSSRSVCVSTSAELQKAIDDATDSECVHVSILLTRGCYTIRMKNRRSCWWDSWSLKQKSLSISAPKGATISLTSRTGFYFDGCLLRLTGGRGAGEKLIFQHVAKPSATNEWSGIGHSCTLMVRARMILMHTHF
jgi:hypothetical protein